MDQQQPETTTAQAPTNANQAQTAVAEKKSLGKTVLLILILTIIAFILVGLAMHKPSNNQQVTAQSTPTPTPLNPAQTTLTISPLLIKSSTSAAYSDDIIINTGQNYVDKVQLEVSYNPNELTKIDIVPGAFFDNPQIMLKNIDTANGIISFAIGIPNGSTGIIGQGVLARLMFLPAAKVASASVILMPKTQVTADGFSQSVLKSTVNGAFEFATTPTSTPVKKK